MKKRTPLGLAIEESLREALAWKRGEIELPVRIRADDGQARQSHP